MKALSIFRFELAYQIRRLPTWIAFAAIGVVAALFVQGNFLADALYDDFFINSPFVIAVVTVFCSVFWLLVAGAVTGEVAARDWETGMHPLIFTSPVTRREYLGGRFLAAFALHALILLAVPLGVVLAVHLPGVDERVVGPARPEAYIKAYFLLALPNAFIGTAIQFASAVFGRRALASYLGSVMLFAFVYGGIFAVYYFGGGEEQALWLDAFAQVTLLELTEQWTPIEKSTRMISLDANLLRSRLIWPGLASCALSLTYARFRFVHYDQTGRANIFRPVMMRRRGIERSGQEDFHRSSSRPVVNVHPAFSCRGFFRAVAAIAAASFKVLLRSKASLITMPVITALIVVIVPEHMENMGTPLLPKTAHLLTFLTASLTNFMTPWVVIPLLTILYAGELVWRERAAGLGEISDATPVSDGGFLLGRFLGLALMLIVWMVLLMVAGILVQLRMGYYVFELPLYMKVLFGLQLPEYLLFACLALVVQGIINQKFLGHLVAVLVYMGIIFASRLGVHHNLLVYGGGPAWAYSDMRGFGPSLAPWLWFKLYWAAWALLLALLARLLWTRGISGGVRQRIRSMRRGLTRRATVAAVAIIGVITSIGGYILYNTNILNEYAGASKELSRRAEYERRYARFRFVPQPSVKATNLRVDLYPDKREARITGSYSLVNRTGVAIDTIHIATYGSSHASLDREYRVAIADDLHGHQSYVLSEPLRPGDSVQLSFALEIRARGFRNSGANPMVVKGGTYFTNKGLLPAIGYQPSREIIKPGERRAQGLHSRPLVPGLAELQEAGDVTGETNHEITDAGHASFSVIMSTDEPETPVAPGALQRAWTLNGRRYAHFATDVIGDEYAFFSANYTLHKEWRNGIAIEVYHFPGHKANVGRILRSVRASLENYSREFGAYPFPYLRLVENPVRNMGAHADAASIDYGQGFSLFDPADDPKGLDFPFAIIAHEMAHQWWGAQLPYAHAEGLGLLTESPAWYSAMGVVEETYGREHLHRLMRFFRRPYPIPPIRQSVPLLRGKDPYALYRKGPFALFALSEFMGKDRVNGAYRRLIERHNAGTLPMATSLDLYRELQAVTPDSLQYLLHDLLAANTFWQLETRRATSIRLPEGGWRVDLRIHARKITVDSAGIEYDVTMNEWIPVGVFGRTGDGPDFGKTLYLQKHLIHSGEQTVSLIVPKEPADGGVDPFHLLIDIEPFDNVERIRILDSKPTGGT